jgi:D-alanyl-D-alanine carboxypeptidase/D-alanyl-D-alanine carboxypeptidase (penicillin-binding protein 5/6)
MKKITVFILLVIILTGSVSAAAPLSVSAESAVLITTDGNRVVYGKNENKKLGVASTTKIMTSLLAIEYGHPNMEIVTTKEMVTVEGTSMGLKEGDTVTVKALIYGMLLQSGNDAANTTALVIADGKESFAKLMNDKAKQLGMSNTNFVNPTGLWHKEHYSTAYDMAVLGAAAVSNPAFVKICSLKSASLEYGNPPYKRTLYNHNRLLSSYDGAIGIKTGFTKNSGRCLVSAAQKDGITLICVTLNAPNDWGDHKKLLNYGFSTCEITQIEGNLTQFDVPVVGGIIPKVTVEPFRQPQYTLINGKSETVTRQVYIEPFVYAPVKTGKIVGRMDYYIGDALVESVSLVAKFDVETEYDEDLCKYESFINKIRSFLKERADLIFKK